MPAPEIRVFKDLETLSRAAAAKFTAATSYEKPDGGIFTAALSGGSTPERFYELLATPEFSSKVSWPRVHLFQVDERCVPPDDAESNYRMIRQAMLDRIPLPSANFHRMAAEQPDREDAARRYEAEMRKTLDAPAPAWPSLGLVYLGIGDDGHTASLFPGTTALEERERAVCSNYVEKLKMFRLTLTFPVLNAAAEVIFLVAGSGKAETLRQILHPSTTAIRFPAQRIQPAQDKISWYVDESAAQLL